MINSTWCIKANSEEEGKVLFPFFNEEAKKYGFNWKFDIFQQSHKDYYVFSNNKSIFISIEQPKNYKLYSFNSFVKKIINKNKSFIYELW